MFGLDLIKQLKPCKWRYIGQLDDGVEHFGFIAQEVCELLPSTQYGVVVIDQNGVYGLRLTELIGPMVKAIQELEAKIKILEGANNAHQGVPGV